MDQTSPALDITDDTSASRFEADIEGHTAFVQYRRGEGTLTLLHTEVPQALEGRGIGSALARAVLERARAEGVRLIVQCPFITKYIERHPEYRSLVAGPATA